MKDIYEFYSNCLKLLIFVLFSQVSCSHNFTYQDKMDQNVGSYCSSISMDGLQLLNATFSINWREQFVSTTSGMKVFAKQVHQHCTSSKRTIRSLGQTVSYRVTIYILSIAWKVPNPSNGLKLKLAIPNVNCKNEGFKISLTRIYDKSTHIK